MNNWKKTSLVTTLIVLLILVGVFFLFNVSISIPSSNIEFSPGEEVRTTLAEFKGKKPKNIIVFIVDGMGFNHLSLALQTQQSENQPSVWDQFAFRGWHNPRSIYGPLTDSEASATAMATGTSTGFGHIGIDTARNQLENVFELAAARNYATGIVTDSYIWDGTPAAFIAHTRNEDDARDILSQIANSDLDLIFGELEDLGEGDIPEKAESIEILERRFQLLDHSLEIPEEDNNSKPIAAVFDEDEIQDINSTPNLTRMAEVALAYLSDKEKPFLLLVESEEMDEASHKNDSKRVLSGLQSIQQTLALVLDYAKADGETLVIFTADHETGGLTAVADYNTYPDVQIKWSTKEHSAAVVPLFADGPGADYFVDVYRNRHIGQRLKMLIRNETTIESDTIISE